METENQETRIWLASHNIKRGIGASQTALASFPIKLTEADQKRLKGNLETSGHSYESWVNAAFTLLMHRVSTNTSLQISIGEGCQADGELRLNPSIRTVNSTLTAELTCADYLEHLTQQRNTRVNTKIPYSDLWVITQKKPTKNKKPIVVDSHHVQLALLVDIHPAKPFILYYKPAQYSDAALRQLKSMFIQLLKSLEQAHAPIVTLHGMPKADLTKILHTWCEPDYPFPRIKPVSTVQERLSLNAKRDPNQVLIKHAEASARVLDIDLASTHFAARLIERGINLGDAVCVYMDRSIDLITVMLGIFKAGATFVPLNPKYPADRIEYILNDTKSSCIITQENSNLSQDFRHLAWCIQPTDFEAHSTTITLPSANADRIAYIIYTSGTTGKPKGVMVSHRNLMNLVAWYESCFSLNSRDIVSQFASQGFDSYFCETIPALSVNATLTIVDDAIKLSPSLFFDWLADEKVTVCDLPTAYAQFLFTQNWPREAALRLVKIGGEAITSHPSTLFHFDLWNTYGPTEATVESTYFKIYDAKSQTYTAYQSPSPPIGKPLFGGKVYIVDSFMQPSPPGVAGELLIGGEGVSSGYLNRLDLTEQKFIANPFDASDKGKLYRTGDLALWLDDGQIEFVGRIDNQIKLRGYRIELSDIENAIGQHPDVSEVVVLAREGINGEKSLVAYVVPNLDKERFLFQERCLITDDDINFSEAITEDISKYGISISGLQASLPIGKKIGVHLKLPGFNQTKCLGARLIWQKDGRGGFVFDLSEADQTILTKSIDYFISKHNVMELVLSASTKRSLRKALQAQLPEYMIPSTFISVLEFPLNLNGKIDVKSLPQPDEHEKLMQRQFIEAKTDTEKWVASLWSELLSRPQISMSDNFFDIGGNSLLAAQLSLKISDKYQLAIPANILFDLAYVPILAEYIDTKGTNYTTESNIQAEISADKVLPDGINPSHHHAEHLTPPENILLTGAGGFLGVYILRDLLKHTNAKVHCLVRQGEFETAAKRLMTTVKKFGLDKDISLADRRIIAIPSDISFNHFGLPQEQYIALAQKIDLIIHCGAQVNIMASYQKLRGSNVQGTLEVLKFATNTKDKPIHYVSTLSSAYVKDAAGTLAESFPTDTFDNLFGGYAITKWVSEVLLRQAKDRGLPVTIYRSGYIFGDSQSGILSLNDALLMLMKGCIQLGFAPTMKERITLLPVDTVSRAINGIALSQGARSAVYHIDHPTGIMWSDLVAWLNSQGYRIKLISLKEWKQRLKTITRDNALYPFLPYYLALPDDYQSTDVATTLTVTALESLGIHYPNIDDALLKTYLTYLQTVGFFPAPVDA